MSRSTPRRASTTSTRRSASSTLRQAARTIACSRRRPGARREDAGGVDEHQLGRVPDGDPEDPTPRGLDLGRDDRDLGADQAIEQGRLADVRRAQDGDEPAAGRLVRSWLFVLGRRGAPAAALPRPARRPAWSCRSPSPARRSASETAISKVGAWGGPDGLGHLIGGQAEPAALGPFLKRGLGVRGGAAHLDYAPVPMARG